MSAVIIASLTMEIFVQNFIGIGLWIFRLVVMSVQSFTASYWLNATLRDLPRLRRVRVCGARPYEHQPHALVSVFILIFYTHSCFFSYINSQWHRHYKQVRISFDLAIHLSIMIYLPHHQFLNTARGLPR
jgi:hypothetical protein